IVRLGAAALLLFIAVLPAAARHRSDAWARTQFANAERMREALNGRPAEERTRREYERVMNAYRRVYFGAPTATKADPSVVASAELMVEMGRRFNDDDVLRSAIAQYNLLRREYPGSKYRFAALFTIAEVYKDDLHDSRSAREAFEEFLRRYPRHHLASEARTGLIELDQHARRSVSPKKSAAPERGSDTSAEKSAEAKIESE